LILEAYARWGTHCAKRLRGDFAFAIWDRQRRRIFCARDLLGVKSVNYHMGPDVFCFASEMRGVIVHEAVPHELNEGRIADFLIHRLEGIDHHSTFYRDVRRLPPAHHVVISAEGMVIQRYAKLEAPSTLRLRSDSDYAEAFQERIDVAVGESLRCHGAPALMLSGGLDSATLVASARKLERDEGHPPLAVFSAQSRLADCLETHFANAVISQGDLAPTRVLAGEMGAHQAAMENTYEAMEAPFDSNMTLLIAVYQRARRGGHKVLLDGVDGDLVASLGTSYPAYLLRQGQLWMAQREVLGQWKNTYRRTAPLWQLALRTAGPVLLPAMRQWWKERTATKRRASVPLGTVIHPDFAKRIQLSERLEALERHHGDGLAPTLGEASCQRLTHPYLAVALERYNRLASLCGLEARHPLLNQRLVEFCLSLPWEQKSRHGWSKWIMRHAGEARLPRTLCWRRGHEHLGGSFSAHWMSLHATSINAELQAPDPLLENYVDLATARRAWYAHRHGGSFDDQVNAWYAYILSRWLRRQKVSEF
ncbi:MAG: hypothetical protein JRH20_14850, partial [Deltaproteobacteria bacterium]|nr:hypothetical protein [Deltaproteobacteria bacterium]